MPQDGAVVGCKNRWSCLERVPHGWLSGYSTAGDRIASGGRDQTVRLWDAEPRSPGPVLVGHTEAVTIVLYSPYGQQIAWKVYSHGVYFATGCDDHSVRQWQFAEGENRYR